MQVKLAKKRNEYGEYVVKAFDADGSRYPQGDYFTNDWADALATSEAMAKHTDDHNNATLLGQTTQLRDELVHMLATVNYVGSGRQYHEARLVELNAKIARLS